MADDQSSSVKPSDLQVAKASGTATMSCPMAHQMELIQINLNTKTDVQNIKYTIASSGYTFYDYLTNITSSKSHESSKKPYQSNNTTHYYIATVGSPSSFSATSTIASTADTGNGWTQSESVPSVGQLHDLLLTFSKTCGGNDGLITDVTIWTPTFANNYPSTI